jgi:hypothetical protein
MPDFFHGCGRIVRLSSLSCILLALTLGCSGESAGTPGDIKRQIVVRPHTSEIVSVTYYVLERFGDHQEWSQFDPQVEWPPGGKVTTTVTTVAQAQASSRSGALEPSLAATDSTIVALFTGGDGSGGALASSGAVLYSASGGPTALQMVEARTSHTMSNLPGQAILIAGGYGAAGNPLASAEVFVLDSRSFGATGSMRVGRGQHAAAMLNDGRVLVTGGLVLQGVGPATIDDGTTEIFTPTTGQFTDGPDMTVTRYNHSAVTLLDGRVLVLGGGGRRSAEVYDPATNQFTPVEDMQDKHGLGHVALRLASGKVLVTGGDSTINVNPTATAELFDPATNQFTTIGFMTAPRMQHFAVLLDDGRILIGGGRTTNGSELATTEIYDPAANTFTPDSDLPSVTSDQAAAFVLSPSGS